MILYQGYGNTNNINITHNLQNHLKANDHQTAKLPTKVPTLVYCEGWIAFCDCPIYLPRNSDCHV